MKYISYLLFLFSAGYATEYAPWFSPPWEFHSRVAYWYENTNHVQSPLGSFQAPSRNSSLHLGLDVTPWPYWSIEAELFFTHTHEVAFGYEASLVTLRYAWLDDISTDWISLVTGVTLSFPGNRFLHQFSFDYHGNVNAEFHATVGKEWAFCNEWVFRIWALGGYGIANRGSPWVHGMAVAEYKLCPFLDCGLFTEAVYGLGHQDIIPTLPFTGYGSINHQSIDLGGFVKYAIRYLGTLTASGWYNLHARNFIEQYWGINISLCIPFSIL